MLSIFFQKRLKSLSIDSPSTANCVTSLRIMHQFVWTSQKKFFDAYPERIPESKFWTSVQKTNFNDRSNEVFQRPSKQSISMTIQMKNFSNRPNEVFRRPSKRSILATMQMKNFDDRPNNVFRQPSKTRFPPLRCTIPIMHYVPSTWNTCPGSIFLYPLTVPIRAFLRPCF